MTGHPSPRFQLVVFDVAGTTVLDGDLVVDCMQAVLDDRVIVTARDVRDVMGLPKPLAIRQLLSTHGTLRGDALQQAVEETHAKFRSALIASYQRDAAIAPAPDVLRVLSALRRADIRVVLDTGFSRDILESILSRLGWVESGATDFSIASDEVEPGRPHPDMIYRAMSLVNVAEPLLVVKVGDTPADVMQELAAGCGLVVGVTYGTHSRTQLEREGVRDDRPPAGSPAAAWRRRDMSVGTRRRH